MKTMNPEDEKEKLRSLDFENMEQASPTPPLDPVAKKPVSPKKTIPEPVKTVKAKKMQSVEDLIKKGRLAEALEFLSKKIPEYYRNDVILQQSRLTSLERSERLGTISGSEASISRNRISNAALELAKELDPEDRGVSGESNRSSEIRDTDKKKILFLAANPTDTGRLQIDREHQKIIEQLSIGRARDSFAILQPRFAVRLTDLLRAMNDKPNIVHFSGHGGKDGIIVAKEDNTRQPIPTPALKRLFKSLEGTTEIVILNACYSAPQAKAISEFGIYVVGNNMPISDPAAISFSVGFYNALGEGKSFEDAFNDAMFVVLVENAKYEKQIEVWKDGELLKL